MKYFKVIVAGGLCASLFFNYILLRKLDDIDNKLNNVSNYQNQVIATVNSQIGNINNTIHKMKDEQSWLSAVKVGTVLEGNDRNKAEVTFEWQVKELQSNSEVFFNYKRGNDKEYTPIQAVPKGNGLFGVSIPIQITPEPNWDYQINDRRGNDERTRKIVEQKEAYENDRRVSFNYYISVSHGDIIKNGEINVARAEDIGARYYGYLEVRTDINKDNNYTLSVMNGRMSDTSVYLKEAYLKKYSNGQLVKEEKLVEENVIHEGGRAAREDSVVFRTKSSEEKIDYSSLVLKVVYSDGSVFEREVYTR